MNSNKTPEPKPRGDSLHGDPKAQHTSVPGLGAIAAGFVSPFLGGVCLFGVVLRCLALVADGVGGEQSGIRFQLVASDGNQRSRLTVMDTDQIDGTLSTLARQLFQEC